MPMTLVKKQVVAGLLSGAGLLTGIVWLFAHNETGLREAISVTANNAQAVTTTATNSTDSTNTIKHQMGSAGKLPCNSDASNLTTLFQNCTNLPPTEAQSTTSNKNTDDGPMDEKKLLEGYTSKSAIAVLKVEPGASINAYNIQEKCSQQKEFSVEDDKECQEINSIMHFVRMDLIFEAENGNAKAALLMAQSYTEKLSPSLDPILQTTYANEARRFIYLTKGQFSQETNQLQQTLNNFH